jgi:N-acyl-D-amino-acid deacylase
MVDLLIKNGKVFDGTGNSWFKADVYVKDGRIAKIGKNLNVSATQIIDADGLAVAPGFWDHHTHDDFCLGVKNHPDIQECRVRSGITTIVTGNCGYSPWPYSPEFKEAAVAYNGFLDAGMTNEWKDLAGYLTYLKKQGIILNMATNVGQGAIRLFAMGFEASKPNERQMNVMKEQTKKAMEQGAFGITTGLLYPPGMFSPTEEVIELAKIVSEHGGHYASHMRGESETLFEAVKEVITIGEKAKMPVFIHHHEAFGEKYFWKIGATLKLIREARDVRGVDINYDFFPYTGANTTIAAIFPPWSLEGGVPALLERLKDSGMRKRMLHDIETEVSTWPPEWPHNFGRVVAVESKTGWDNILIIWANKNKNLQGMTLGELGKKHGKHPFEAACDITLEEACNVMCIFFGSSGNREEDYAAPGLIEMIKDPLSILESDAIIGKEMQHPAAWGTTARTIGRYAREMGLITMEEAVRKLTSAPAHILGIYDRGILRPGCYADITIFNPKTIIDTATYTEAKAPVGIEYVIVNGTVVLEKGKYYKDKLCGSNIKSTDYR